MFEREGSFIFEQIIEGFRKLESRNKNIAIWYYVKLYSDLWLISGKIRASGMLTKKDMSLMYSYISSHCVYLVIKQDQKDFILLKKIKFNKLIILIKVPIERIFLWIFDSFTKSNKWPKIKKKAFAILLIHFQSCIFRLWLSHWICERFVKHT